MMASGLWIKKLKHEMLNVFSDSAENNSGKGPTDLAFSFLKTLASWNIRKIKVEHNIYKQPK